MQRFNQTRNPSGLASFLMAFGKEGITSQRPSFVVMSAPSVSTDVTEKELTAVTKQLTYHVPKELLGGIFSFATGLPAVINIPEKMDSEFLSNLAAQFYQLNSDTKAHQSITKMLGYSKILGSLFQTSRAFKQEAIPHKNAQRILYNVINAKYRENAAPFYRSLLPNQQYNYKYALKIMPPHMALEFTAFCKKDHVKAFVDNHPQIITAEFSVKDFYSVLFTLHHFGIEIPSTNENASMHDMQRLYEKFLEKKPLVDYQEQPITPEIFASQIMPLLVHGVKNDIVELKELAVNPKYINLSQEQQNKIIDEVDKHVVQKNVVDLAKIMLTDSYIALSAEEKSVVGRAYRFAEIYKKPEFLEILNRDEFKQKETVEQNAILSKMSVLVKKMKQDSRMHEFLTDMPLLETDMRTIDWVTTIPEFIDVLRQDGLMQEPSYKKDPFFKKMSMLVERMEQTPEIQDILTNKPLLECDIRIIKIVADMMTSEKTRGIADLLKRPDFASLHVGDRQNMILHFLNAYGSISNFDKLVKDGNFKELDIDKQYKIITHLCAYQKDYSRIGAFMSREANQSDIDRELIVILQSPRFGRLSKPEQNALIDDLAYRDPQYEHSSEGAQRRKQAIENWNHS